MVFVSSLMAYLRLIESNMPAARGKVRPLARLPMHK
jgi:hypothetical protein